MSSSLTRILGTAITASVLAATPLTMAHAQDNQDEARLRKIEAEIRALQRTVFPGGDSKYFEPEIRPGTQVSTTNAPSTTAVTDILVRLDAIEGQLQRLTAKAEENGNAIADLQARVAVLEPQPEPQLEPSPQSQPAELPAATTPAPARPAVQPASTPTPPATATGPSAARLAAVQEITKPQTDDPGDDEYSYGFRLWNAGFYPEARQQLSLYLEQHPSHGMTSYGRNLLGRAYLDDGQPEEAARWFLRNYQTDKDGRRAGDSLLFLAEAMIAMKDTNRACIALAEFSETYPALAAGRLLDQYEASRQKVRCN
ncbi:hypothetical protein IM511_09635 [Erythrobacteraceae bacterium E2-1 Yellow Sea]|nr:hypothetical protein [Erythrobacteraceae bacterium E2-1 Yellow Sea]